MVRYSRHHDGRFAKAGKAVSAGSQRAAKQAELAERATRFSPGGTRGQALHRLFDEYLSHLARKGDDSKTVRRNRYALARHFCWLNKAGVEVTEVTEVLIEH